MNIKGIRIHKLKMKKTIPILKNNTVLSMGLGLPFAIVPSLTLKNGIVLSILMMVATIIPVAFYSAMGDNIKKEYKIPISVLISMSLITSVIYFLNGYISDVLDSIGVYAYMLSVNSLIFYCEVKSDDNKTVKNNISFAFRICLGFAIVVCFVSVLREILVSQTVLGLPVKILPIKIQGLSLPFFGFILLGFSSAFFGDIERKIEKKILAGNSKEVERNMINNDR